MCRQTFLGIMSPNMDHLRRSLDVMAVMSRRSIAQLQA
jgi:hypothetical protein